MAVGTARAYYVVPIDLTPDGTRTLVIQGDFIDIYATTADVTKVLISVDDGPALPLSSFLPAEFMVKFSRITLSWAPSEVGKTLTLLVGGEYKYRRHIQAVTLTEDRSGILTTLRERLTTTTSGNLRVSVSESTIKQPVDIQDHWSEAVEIVPSSARTSSGTGSDVDVGRFAFGEICLDVTAVSGTSPSLSVIVEGKSRGQGKYKEMFRWSGVSSVLFDCYPVTHLTFSIIRARWEISGTSPSFTFSVWGELKS